MIISPGDARAQTADTLCRLGKREAAATRADDPKAPLALITPADRRPLPAISFVDEGGETRSLGDLRGRPLVVSFWATWCTPCVAELPTLDALAGALAEEADEAVAPRVLALSQDRGGAATVRAFFARVGISHLDILVDPAGAAARALKAPGLPLTVVVDAQGREAARHAGARDWSAPDVRAVLSTLAAEAEAAAD